jgi:hypothetical protein
LHDYLAVLGNPYASLQVDDDKADSPAVAATSLQFRKTENPYAHHYYFPEDAPVASEVRPNPEAPEHQPVGELTKSAFQTQVRGLFRPYIPAAEHGKLRDHHREFIARNESRSPQVRYRLVAQLRKYDISNLSGLTPLFNREEDLFTKKKLVEIERFVGSNG